MSPSPATGDGHRRFTALITLAMVAGCGGSGSTPSAGAPTSDRTPAPEPRPAVAPLDSCELGSRFSANELQEHEDLEYAPRDGWTRRLDLSVPPGEGPHPLVLLFHAGGWANGDEDELARVRGALAARGFAAASVRYRLANRPTPRRFPAGVSDVRCALRYLRAHAERYSLDTTRVVAGGFSAGGHLAAMLATTAERTELDDGTCPRSGDVSVAGAFSFYGPLDLRSSALVGDYAHRLVDNFLGSARDDATRALASPAAQLSAGDPPLLLVHGEDDDVVAIDDGRAMRGAAARADVAITLLALPGQGHGFPLLVGDPELARADCTTLQFLRERLTPRD